MGRLLRSPQLCWHPCPRSTGGARPSAENTATSPSSQVFLSTRRGTWVLHRVADGGYPFDLCSLSRFLQLFGRLLPQNAINFVLERKLNARFDHALYGLQPQHR